MDHGYGLRTIILNEFCRRFKDLNVVPAQAIFSLSRYYTLVNRRTDSYSNERENYSGYSSTNPLKAPGPHGGHAIFYKKY